MNVRAALPAAALSAAHRSVANSAADKTLVLQAFNP
jgi:hypothetical protein